MANKLLFGTQEDGYAKLDEFYKSLMFQEIMDTDLTQNEKSVMLVIFRKSIHYDKWSDRLCIHWFAKSIGISDKTLRATLKKLELLGLIEIETAKGGRTSSSKRFNKYSISNYFIGLIYRKWEDIKLENGFTIEYEDDV